MTRLVRAEIWYLSIPMTWSTAAAACLNTLFPSCSHYRHFDPHVNIFLTCSMMVFSHFGSPTMDLGRRGHARSCINSCPGCSAQVQFLKPSQELYSSALPLRTAVLLMSLRNQLSSALSGLQQILLPVILCFP